MKLIFAMYCLLMLAACHKEPKEVPEEFDFDKEPAGTYFQGVINFRIQNQEGKDLLWGENRVPDEQIQVLYRENGKKKVYFRKNVIAPWVHGFVVHRLREGDEWLDNGYLELYLIVPDIPKKLENNTLIQLVSYTYLRLGKGKQQREITLKAEWDYCRDKGLVLFKVRKVYIDNKLFWYDDMYPYPVLTVK